MDLNLCLYALTRDHPGVHAQVLMRDLGITYQRAVPQSIVDSWWFLGCSNVPNEVPKCLTPKSITDYYAFVGWGLSADDAKHLTEWRESQKEVP